MSLSGITEFDVEEAALDWLRDLGWRVTYGPNIAPDTLGAERADYGEVILSGRLRDALDRLNPDLPAATLGDAHQADSAGRAYTGDSQPGLPPYGRGRRDSRVPRR